MEGLENVETETLGKLEAFYTSGDIEKDFEFLRDKVSSIEPRK